MSFYDWGWAPRPSVGALKQAAKREAAALRKKGRKLEPVVITGRAITGTFWGKAWCENLERYSDFENRLPRGRSYVRNGLVLDLSIEPGMISALVHGSWLYETTIGIEPVPKKRWKSICTDLAGSIDSLVELLQGRFSAAVMERICRPGAGLFPSPAEIRFECSCPDFASMCKHVAAALYGIGARLDERPELLFTLRRVDASEIVAKADGTGPLATGKPRKGRVLAGADMSQLFGLEMGTGDQRAKKVGERRPVREAKGRRSANKGATSAGKQKKKRKKQ